MEFPTYVFCARLPGLPQIVYRNNLYQFKRGTKFSTMFACQESYAHRAGCRATIKVGKCGRLLSTAWSHNHPEIPENELKAIFAEDKILRNSS